MKRSILVLFVGCVLGMPAAFLGGKYLMGAIADWRATHFTCDASLVVSNLDHELALRMSYVMDGDNGIVIYKGRLIKDGQRYSISRKNYFIIQRTQKLLRLTSTSVYSMPTDNVPQEDLRQLLPLFYLNHGVSISVKIYPEGFGGYVFSTGYVPSFYCRDS